MKVKSIIKAIVIGIVIGIYTVVMSLFNLKTILPDLELNIENISVNNVGSLKVVFIYVILTCITKIVVDYLFNMSNKSKKR